MLLHQLFEASVRRLPDKTALICGGHRYSYAEVEHEAARLACAMQGRGVRRGDRVAVFMDNAFEAVAAIYAILKVGAVFMPVNALTKSDKLSYVLNDASAACLVTHRLLAGIWRPALARNEFMHTCFVVGGPDQESAGDARCVSYPADRDAGMPPDGPPAIDQDLAAIIYTSGSTGDPKGVMLTHLNMVTAAAAITSYLELYEDDIIMCVLPLAFDYGLYQILMGFMQGATVVLERSFAFPVKILEAMAHERVTVFPGVPTVFSLLMNVRTLAEYDLGALRIITNTAAALSERHIHELRAAFPQAALFSMYGLTECKRVSYLPPDQLDIRPASVGRGMPNEEVWLVDDAGNRLPNGATGELVIRGSHVMRGYWEKPDETAARLKPGPYPGEVVLHSGDMFRTDGEGYLYFVSRKDDIIKTRGEKVSPREVENVLYGLEGVLEAAVVGAPDGILGQSIKAFVTLKEGYHYTERDVIKYCLARLENFMAPKYVVFTGGLPKTDTGKIRKIGLA